MGSLFYDGDNGFAAFWGQLYGEVNSVNDPPQKLFCRVPCTLPLAHLFLRDWVLSLVLCYFRRRKDGVYAHDESFGEFFQVPT